MNGGRMFVRPWLGHLVKGVALIVPFDLVYQFAVRWRKPSFWGVYFFYLLMFAFSFGLAWRLMEVMA